jgi:hypothetical protein
VEDGKVDTSAFLELFFSFSSNTTGDIDGVAMKVEAALDPITFKRKPKTIEVTKEALDKYVGEYELAGTAIKIYIKDENVLYAFVPGQPEYELLATGKHTFTIKILEGYNLEFVEADDGNIKGVKFIQPNGTFTATKK